MKPSFKIWLAIGIGFQVLAVAKCQNSTTSAFESFAPKDPWRAINGQTNYIKLNGVFFCGKIVDVMTDGVRIEGEYGLLPHEFGASSPWLYYPPEDFQNMPDYSDYFVENFPYEVVNGDRILANEHLMAWYVGTYAYDTAGGGTRTIHKLDYGIPCDPNPDLIAALERQRKANEAERKEITSKQFEQIKSDATNGDSSAQFSLGIHYLHGIGGETNQANAIYWLKKSAAHGNLDASNDLQEIKDQSANSSAIRSR